MKKILATAATALAMIASPANANKLIAGHVYYVDASQDLALKVELSDSPASPEQCDGHRGLHIAQTLATSRRTYPQMIPHGRGCYLRSHGMIYVFVYTSAGPMTLEYREDLFIKTSAFTEWPDQLR